LSFGDDVAQLCMDSQFSQRLFDCQHSDF
jgi:hypothetical protein